MALDHGLNDFINDIGKSRNRDLCSKKIQEGVGGGHKMFLAKGVTFVWGLEKFKGVDTMEDTMQS